MRCAQVNIGGCIMALADVALYDSVKNFSVHGLNVKSEPTFTEDSQRVYKLDDIDFDKLAEYHKLGRRAKRITKKTAPYCY